MTSRRIPVLFSESRKSRSSVILAFFDDMENSAIADLNYVKIPKRDSDVKGVVG